MKIVRNDVKLTKFDDVAVGSVFIQDDTIYMKTLEIYEIEEDDYEEELRYKYNAIDLGNGAFYRFVGHDMVMVCGDAYLVIN